MTPDFPKTLTEALDRNQDPQRTITYISGQDGRRRISYIQLKQRALGMLFHLHQKGLAPGDELIIHLDENEQFIDAFWACQYGSIVAVPIAIGTSDSHRQKLFNVFQTLQSGYLITTRKQLERLHVYAQENGLEDVYKTLHQKTVVVNYIESLDQLAAPTPPLPEQTAFIQFSSGSTGDPKGVVLTHKNLMTNLNSIIVGAEFTDQDSFFGWMPLTHDMGIIGFHLTPLVCNINQYLMPTDLFVRRASLWLEMVSEVRATILSSPNFGYKHYLKRFKPEQQSGLDLSCVRLIFNGAEPISAELCREFNAAMAPFGLNPTAMYTVYGLAEACLAVSFPKPNSTLSTIHVRRDSLIPGQTAELTAEPDAQTLELVRCGYPLVDVDVRIADSEGQAVAENWVGRVLIRGDNVTNGYYHADELNQAVFSEAGWLDTGDQGLFNDGQLVITGRTKDLVIVNGQNFYAPDLEAICESVDGIELGKVAICGVRNPQDAIDELVVFVLHRGDMESFHRISIDVRRQMIEKAGLDVALVVPVKNIPKTTSGKVQRFALAERLSNGEFDQEIKELKAISQKDSNADTAAAGSPIENILLTICNTVISDQHIGLNDNLFEMGASSLKLAQIHEQIDEHYPDVLDLTDFFDHPTVAELAAFLESRIGAN